MHIFQLIILICKLNTEGFCKAVAEVVARTGLQCLAIMHQRFNCIGCFCTRKFFFFRFASLDHRNRKYLLSKIRIFIQHPDRTLFCFFSGCMCRMAFLPQKLSGTQKRTGFFFPANNVTPLIIYLRKVSVGLDIIFIKITEQCLRSRANAQTLLKLLQTTIGYPCNLGRESLYMILFFFQKALRNEHGHIYILSPCRFKSLVELLLDQLPNRIAGWFDRHTALYAGIADQLCLQNHIGIPLGKIGIHGCDRFYHFFVVCHDFSPFL